MGNKLGNYLKELRGLRSLREVDQETQRLGNRISFTALANYERGTSSKGNPIKPTPAQLNVLSKVYHVDYEKLMMIAGYLPTPTNVRIKPTSTGADVTADTNWDNPNSAGETSTGDTSNVVPMTHTIPVYGTIAAGTPIFADENVIGETYIPDELIKEYGRKYLFALRVKGDSMSKIIPSGFVAVFAKDMVIESGDIVAVLIDGDEATLKRYHNTSRAVIFEPESYTPHQSYIFPKDGDHNFRILGKYVFATSLLQ